MTWTTEHDIILCREVLVAEPYTCKAGTREKGQCWDSVAENLNAVSTVRFQVDQRGVRDRYSKLVKIFKRKTAAEERASGISPEVTELDMALENIIELAESAEGELARGDESKRKSAEKEKETAESVRKRSMERLAETREREREFRECKEEKER